MRKRDDATTFYEPPFDDMFDGVAYCQMIFSEDGRPVDFTYLQINKDFEKITGLFNVVGKKVTEVIPGIVASNPELFSICSRVSLTGKPERGEMHIETSAKWFLLSVYSMKKNFFVMVFQNITDKKRIEKELNDAVIAARNVLEDLQFEKQRIAEVEAKEEAILLSIGNGLIATDEKGDIIMVNEAAEKLLGRKSKEIIGKLFSDVIPLMDEKKKPVPLEKRPINMALATNSFSPASITNSIYYYEKEDKTIFPVAIMERPVILEGKVIGTINIFRDITKEKEIDRAKSEFVSLASHQLRTPLTSIKWNLEMLLSGKDGELTQKQKKRAEELYRGNERMVEMVKSLLSVSRIEAGSLSVKRKMTDVGEIMKEVVKEQIPIVKDKKHDVVLEVADGLPKISTDPALVRMIIQNLFGNAVEYTNIGGKIACAVTKTGDNIIIEIKDTGIGIPEEQKIKIFQKLFRAENAVKERPEGNGLELYITKGMVDALSGKIWFESEKEKGTTFFVALPIGE
jgi:PAS domain S-box-containing protein